MADSTRRVSVRLSLDDAARVKQELREVGETGQRSLERIQGGADRASRALDLLDVAVRGVQIAGLAAGLRAVVVAGDALTQSMGRLNTALGSVERAGEIYDRLYRDSLQTGVAVRESVDAFARFSIAAREIGATSDQVATLVGGGADLAGGNREAGECVDALAHGDAGLQAVAIQPIVDLAGPLDGAQRGVEPAHGLGERVAGHHHCTEAGGEAGDLHAADRDVEQVQRAGGTIGTTLDALQAALAGFADLAQLLLDPGGVIQRQPDRDAARAVGHASRLLRRSTA